MARRQKNLLIIDDDKLFGDAVAAFFHTERFQVTCAYSGAQGLAWCRKNKVDVVLLDQNLPDCEGIDICQEILACNDQTKIIFATAFPSFDHAVQALRNGAHDYISKPMELEELKLAVDLAFRTVQLEHVEQVQEFHNRKDLSQNTLLGLDGGLTPVRELIERAADNRSPVLITGETGTGKTVVAKTIHYLQGNSKRPFIDTNCAALPENLIESELFGFEKGAFTGAINRRKGLFEMADGGTLFLDEIGEMPLHLQPKLLGVLDSGIFRRLGGQAECFTDVRIIAATNIDLEQAISNKKFREDLYYRMSVMRIHLPPLRERKEDISLLTEYFLANIAPEKRYVISAEEISRLEKYDWPGNVRELRNIIERSIILGSDNCVYPSKLLREKSPADIPSKESVAEDPSNVSLLPLAEMEKAYIRRVLDLCLDNRSQAAKILGIARSTLLRKIEQYALDASVANR
jgi:DNA-binding NtrC family response regulator